MEYNPQFWQALDQLLARSALVIDRPKGSSHPRFPEMVYPLDYGYLENTASMDGEGVDVWVGTAQPPALDGLLWVVDLPKGDVEVKLLYGCTPRGLAQGRRGGKAPLRLHPPRAGAGLPVPKPAALFAGPAGPASCGASGKIIAQKTFSCIVPGPVNFPRRPACFFCPRNFIIVLNWNNKQRKVEYYGGKIGQGHAPACYQSM